MKTALQFPLKREQGCFYVRQKCFSGILQPKKQVLDESWKSTYNMAIEKSVKAGIGER
jgi:hypothetical protein